jgi:hypothetical protein
MDRVLGVRTIPKYAQGRGVEWCAMTFQQYAKATTIAAASRED